MNSKHKLLIAYIIPYLLVSLILVPRSAYLTSIWGLSDRILIGFSENMGPIGIGLFYCNWAPSQWWIGAVISISIWIMIMGIVLLTRIKLLPMKYHAIFISFWFVCSFVFSFLITLYS